MPEMQDKKPAWSGIRQSWARKIQMQPMLPQLWHGRTLIIFGKTDCGHILEEPYGVTDPAAIVKYFNRRSWSIICLPSRRAKNEWLVFPAPVHRGAWMIVTRVSRQNLYSQRHHSKTDRIRWAEPDIIAQLLRPELGKAQGHIGWHGSKGDNQENGAAVGQQKDRKVQRNWEGKGILQANTRSVRRDVSKEGFEKVSTPVTKLTKYFMLSSRRESKSDGWRPATQTRKHIWSARRTDFSPQHYKEPLYIPYCLCVHTWSFVAYRRRNIRGSS